MCRNLAVILLTLSLTTLAAGAPLTFKGTVVDAKGKPVAGARVRNLASGAKPGVESDEDGKFACPLEPRQELSGFRSLILVAEHPDAPNARGILRQTLSSERDLEGTIVLVPAYALKGRVLDEDGRPLEGADVTLFVNARFAVGPQTKTQTGADGEYVLFGAVPEVAFQVLAEKEGYGQHWSSPITRDEAEDCQVEDLMLYVADLSIEGLVVDEEGNAVAGASLNGQGRKTGAIDAKTDEEGGFRLENLVDETIQIWVHHQVDGQFLEGNARSRAGSTGVEVVLRPPQSREAQDIEATRLAEKKAPELVAAKWLSSKTVDLAGCKGLVVALVLWDVADKGCEAFLAQVSEVAAAHPDVTLVAIHRALTEEGASEADVKRAVGGLGPAACIALDESAEGSKFGTTFAAYRQHKTPGIFVIDREGKIRFQDIPVAALEAAIDAVCRESGDGKP